MSANIVGLIGAPGAGKDDVVAKRLVEKHGFRRLAFADRIKSCYYKEMGITNEYFKQCRGTPEEEKIRKGLWKYSDEMRKAHGKNYFISPVIEEAVGQKTVITDIRTPDELYETLLRKPRIIVVTRGNVDCDPHYDNFPETRIPYRWIWSLLEQAKHVFSEFKNNSNTLEEAYEQFDNFYQTIGGTDGP